MPPQVKKKRGRPHSQLAPALLRSPMKMKKHKHWSEESTSTMTDLIGDRVGGKVVQRCRRERIIKLFSRYGEAGYGKTRKKIMGLAKSVNCDKG